MVLFGGSPTVPVGNGTAYGNTWTWDGSTWTQQFPPISPPARVWSNMVYYPPTKTVVLFSGTNSANQENCFTDTWVWNGITKTWTELSPATHPAGRTMNPLVYDPATNELVMFGGVVAGLTDLEDTWTWNGVTWAQHFPASNPGPRNGPALAYDPTLDSVVLFGGALGTCCSDNLNDTWTWNGANWKHIFPAGTLPQPRNAANMAYDRNRQFLLVFGGDSSGPALDDTWSLALVP